MDKRARARAMLAEFIGTAFLLAAVIGSGIMGERLAGGIEAIALLANTAATAAALVALILVFTPISGAHLNPAVTLALAWRGDLARGRVPGYLAAQFLGAIVGVALAHLMFDLPAVFDLSTRSRAGVAAMLSEVVATFGLLLVVLTVSRARSAAVPAAVACWVAAGYWFTASTCFANPAVTLARMLSESFAGIRPADAPGFVLAQLVGTALAIAAHRVLGPGEAESSR